MDSWTVIWCLGDVLVNVAIDAQDPMEAYSKARDRWVKVLGKKGLPKPGVIVVMNREAFSEADMALIVSGSLECAILCTSDENPPLTNRGGKSHGDQSSLNLGRENNARWN